MSFVKEIRGIFPALSEAKNQEDVAGDDFEFFSRTMKEWGGFRLDEDGKKVYFVYGEGEKTEKLILDASEVMDNFLIKSKKGNNGPCRAEVKIMRPEDKFMTLTIDGKNVKLPNIHFPKAESFRVMSATNVFATVEKNTGKPSLLKYCPIKGAKATQNKFVAMKKTMKKIKNVFVPSQLRGGTNKV